MAEARWIALWREARLHPARTLLAVLASVVGLVAAGALLDTWAVLREVTDTVYLASQPVSATLRVDSVDRALLDAVAALPQVGAVRARRSVGARVSVDGSPQRALLFAFDDVARPGIGRLVAESGSWPPPPGAIAIERSSWALAGAHEGGQLRLSLGEGPAQTLTVAGQVRDVSQAPGWMEGTVYGYVDARTLEQLGAPAGFDELQLRVADARLDRAGVRRVAETARALIEARGGRVRDVDVPEPGQHVHAAQMNSMLLTQGAFAALTLVVCALLMANLFAAMLAAQVRQIGLVRALGAGDIQIAAHYLAFAAALGLLAALLSFPAALALGRAYARLRADMLNFPLEGASLPLWAVVLQLGAGAAMALAAVAAPLRRGLALSAVEALRDVGPLAPTTRSRWLAVDGLGRPLLLSLGNALRRRGRLALTVLALAAGGAVFLGAASLRAAVIASVDRLFESERYDVLVRLAGAPPADVAERAAAVPGVRRAERWDSAPAWRDFDDGTQGRRLSAIGMPAETQAFRPHLSGGRWLLPGDTRALVVGRGALMDDATLVPGAHIRLSVGGEAAEWTVVGTIESGVGREVYVPRAMLAAVPAGERRSTLAVTLAATGQAAQLATVQRLRAALGEAGVEVASSQRREENRRVFEDHLLMVVQFLGALAWVMLAVGGLGLAATLAIAALERRREIAVLRAVGARGRDLVGLVQAEGLVMAGIAFVVAVPLSLPIGAVLAVAFGQVMFAVPVPWWPPASGLGLWAVLCATTALVAGAWPAWRVVRMPVVQGLGGPGE